MEGIVENVYIYDGKVEDHGYGPTRTMYVYNKVLCCVV